MNTMLATAAVAAPLLLTTGCAQSLSAAAVDSSQTAAAAAPENAAGDVQDSLTQALTAAKAYGRKHLGH